MAPGEAGGADTEGKKHVCLCSEQASGLAVREIVTVRALVGGFVEVLLSPGVVTGCAAGDVVQIVDEDGRFVVTHRGPNECVQAHAHPQFSPKAIDVLSAAFECVGGVVAAPAHRAFVVVTVPGSVGRPWISQQMTEWCAQIKDAEWRFGTLPDRSDDQA